MTTTRGRHATHGRRVLSVRSRVVRAVAALVALPVVVTGLVTIASPAGAIGGISAARSAGSGFPSWYADPAGNRIEPCLDATDANCLLPAAGSEPNYDPAVPLAFPTNFPSEFFYAYAASSTITTTGCLGTPPGKASIVLALEGAFINGDPAPGDQMVFGRTRVRVTSGLCPNTEYQFKHPMGFATVTTNGAGAVTAVLGTEDVGCVPAPGQPCNFSTALTSRVFGSSEQGGFLRWDPTSGPAAPAGYLGDGATPHTVTGGTNGNAFSILDSGGRQLNDANGAPYTTAQFTVAGKSAGPLATDGADFGGTVVTDPATAVTRTISVTNIGTGDVAVPALDAGGATVGGGAASPFAVTGGTCFDATIPSDASCTVLATFAPTAFAQVTDIITLVTDSVVQPALTIHIAGTGINDGDAPVIAAPASVDFGDVRVRTTQTQHVTLTNDGTAPLAVSDVAVTNSGSGSGVEQYAILAEDCTTAGRTIAVNATCSVDVSFAPSVAGLHDPDLQITSNINLGTTRIPLSGTGIGGVAAVSDTVDPFDNFPDWYRDENGVKLSQCIDPKDPYCVVLPDAGFDPADDLAFPTNFPGEFFYTVADSEPITTPGCNGGPEGSVFIRSAVEGTFANGSPVDGEQMVFGRVRIFAHGGLCPNTEYTFTHPYGTTTLRTTAKGLIPPNVGTVDIGCVPVPPDVPCNFKEALTSPVFGGFLRWDPSVAPAAPAGYLGDAATLHKVVGAPYKVDGNPVNLFRISELDGTQIGETELFTVMGKYRGPLEPTGGVDAAYHANLGATAEGSDSSPHTVTFTNTGLDALDVSGVAVTGTDAGDFRVSAQTCTGSLAVDATCTVRVVFHPTAVGDRAAELRLTHTGFNSPVAVTLDGVGGDVGGQAALSFQPRSLAFSQLKVGGTSAAATVTVSNAGGGLPLTVFDAVTSSNDFRVVDNRCTDGVDPGATCQIDIAFTPQADGTRAATLDVTDNTPGGTHQLQLSGVASVGGTSVSAALDPNGYPRWYQDDNGVRLEPCLDTDGRCIVLGDAFYTPARPLTFPSNFPSEFFYAVADSDLVSLDGCGGTSAPGTAMLRVALEGSFADGVPSFGDQITFTRMRFTAKSGLCPNVTYNWVSPYGAFQFQTDGTGGLARNNGTADIGCGAAPGAGCTFLDATGGVVPGTTPGVPAGVATPPGTAIDGFLRWDPTVGPAAPTGYLGDATSFHKVVGGTYIPGGSATPTNRFEIQDSAGNAVASTDRFMVAGKVAGPLYGDVQSADFGHVRIGEVSAFKTVNVTNVSAAPVNVAAVVGAGAQFVVDPASTCLAGALASDATCAVRVQFAPTAPTAVGTKTGSLRITADGDPTGRAVVTALTGQADAVGAPAISVTPGVLSFGNVTPTVTLLNTSTTTIKNTGTADLSITAAPVAGANPADYTLTATTCTADGSRTFPWTILPGATCTVTVRFDPSANGARTATLTLKHNATGGGTGTVVSLTGNGLGSTFSASPNPIGFSKVTVNTTKGSTVSVKNSGTIPVRFAAAAVQNVGGVVGPASGPWSVTADSCSGQVVQPGRTCSVTASFRPTVSGANYTGTLILTGDGTSLPRSVSVNLTGSGK